MSRDQRHAIDQMLRKAPQPFGPVPVEKLREGFAAFMATFPVPPGVRTAPSEVAGRPALIVEPKGDARLGTILYFHGGGNVFGSPETVLPLTANLVVKTGFRAVSPDYRLAPEHPFPAGADDALNAYRALLDSGEDPSAIAFAGGLPRRRARRHGLPRRPRRRPPGARRDRDVLRRARLHCDRGEHEHQGGYRPPLHP